MFFCTPNVNGTLFSTVPNLKPLPDVIVFTIDPPSYCLKPKVTDDLLSLLLVPLGGSYPGFLDEQAAQVLASALLRTKHESHSQDPAAGLNIAAREVCLEELSLASGVDVVGFSEATLLGLLAAARADLASGVDAVGLLEVSTCAAVSKECWAFSNASLKESA